MSVAVALEGNMETPMRIIRSDGIPSTLLPQSAEVTLVALD